MSTGVIFNSFWADLFNNNINPATDTIKVMLVNGYVPNKDTHRKRSDVTGEVTGAGYAAGGKTVGVTITEDDANDRIDMALDVVNWPSATISATGAVFYKSRGGAASADELVAAIDFGATITSTANTWSLDTPTTIRLAN